MFHMCIGYISQVCLENKTVFGKGRPPPKLRLGSWWEKTFCLSHSAEAKSDFFTTRKTFFSLLLMGKCCWFLVKLPTLQPRRGHHCLQACSSFLYLSHLWSFWNTDWVGHTLTCWKQVTWEVVKMVHENFSNQVSAIKLPCRVRWERR